MIQQISDRIAMAMDAFVLWELGKIPLPFAQANAFDYVDPGEFWRNSRVLDPAPVHVEREMGERLDGRVRVVDLEAPSFGPGPHPGARKLIARAHLNARTPDAPTVIILHGFAVPTAWWEERQARTLSALGANVIRLDHPLHLRRRARGTVSGQAYFSADPAHMRAVMRQSAEDAAAVVRWAQTELRSKVSLFGVSLGGGTACLLAGLIELSSVVAIAPFCDPARTLVERMPHKLRMDLGIGGESYGPWGATSDEAQSALNGALAPLIARNLTPPVTLPNRVTLIEPSVDMIVGRQPIAELAEAWGCQAWKLRHSHISVMNARGLMKRVYERLLSGGTESVAGAPSVEVMAG